MDPILEESIVKTNEPPNDFQAREIRLRLSSALCEFEDVNLKILRGPLPPPAELKHHRALYSELVAALRGALSLIRMIPPEILAEIFVMCRDESLKAPTYSIADKAEAPLVLTLVSSRWRSICLSDPRLWDHLRIPPCTRIPPPEFIRQVAKRSSPLALHVQVESSTPQRSWPMEVADQLIRILLDVHGRLRHLDLSGGSLNVASDLWYQSRIFPLLACFSLEISDQAVVGSGRALGLGLFQTAPLLRELTLLAPNSPLDSRATEVTWTQLTVLNLHIRISILQARDILTQSV